MYVSKIGDLDYIDLKLPAFMFRTRDNNWIIYFLKYEIDGSNF